MFTGETLYTPPTQTNTGQTEYAPADLGFAYGQDIARWAVVKPYTMPYTQTGTILSVYDWDYNTYVLYTEGVTNVTKQMDIIFDFGRLLNVRGAFLNTIMNCTGVGALRGECTVTFSYSSDMENWTTIDDRYISATGAPGSTYEDDFLMGAQAIRAFRVRWDTVMINNSTAYLQLRNFSVLV